VFTGIIESMAEVKERTADQLIVECPAEFDDIKIGTSICVSGVCLSVADLTPLPPSSLSSLFPQPPSPEGSLSPQPPSPRGRGGLSLVFDVVEETWNKSKFGSLEIGDKVNLERAMKYGDRFEGHVVQGHCEGVGVVALSNLSSLSLQSLSPEVSHSPQSLSPEVSLSPQPPSPTGRGGLCNAVDWKEHFAKKKTGNIILKRAREMRKDSTGAEEVLWKVLRGQQINGVKFRRQHPIGMFILDFYCHQAKLGIEIDGSIHDNKEQEIYDRDRELVLLENREVHIIRFSNDEIFNNLKWVITQIERAITELPSPLGRGARGEGLQGRGTEGEGLQGRGAEGEGMGEREIEEKQPKNTSLTISIPNSLIKNIHHKGSISLDGVSLTVASIKDNLVTVALIPLTLKNTTLGLLKEGDQVNIETDVLVRNPNLLLQEV